MLRKLGDIATFEYGYANTASNQGKFKFLQTGEIDKYGNILEQKKKYIDLPSNANEDKYLLKENDIITARHGNCGRTAIFQGNEKIIFSNDLIRIKFNKEEILPKYYHFFAQTQKYWDQVNTFIKGTAQPQFNANSLKEIIVPILNLEKQKKIIQERDEEITIINYQEQTINLLEKLRESFLNNIYS